MRSGASEGLPQSFSNTHVSVGRIIAQTMRGACGKSATLINLPSRAHAREWARAGGDKGGRGRGKGKVGGNLALAHLANARIAEQGLFGRSGFTDKQVTGNKHFRLVTALRSEGLGGTKAVARAFDALPPTGRGALMAMKSNARTMGDE